MKKVALITGGAKRLGREIALYLANCGYDIALHYNSSEKPAKNTQTEIVKLDVSCEIFKANLSNESDLISRVHEKFSNLDILINSASIFEKSLMADTSTQFLEKHLKVNLAAPFWLSRDFAKTFKKGHIINILDTRITSQRTSYAAYSISKKALAEMTKMAAFEYAPKIRVNAVAPGLILPPEGKDESYLDNLAKGIPLKRKGTIKSILNTVNFLLNNDYITGQIIFCDGGEHLIKK